MGRSTSAALQSGIARKIERSGVGRPITVLHVVEGLGTGGSEQQLTEFLLHSNQARFRHEVCTLAQVGRFAGILEEAGIPVHPLGVMADGDIARTLSRLMRLVRKVDPHIIHTTLYRPAVVGRVVGRLYAKPVVTTLVNTTYEPEWWLDNPHLSRYGVWLTRAVDRLTARLRGAEFVAVTNSVRASAVRQLRLRSDRVCVIPRGLILNERDEHQKVDAAAVAELKAALGWADSFPIILNVGRLVPQKGQQYAIRAMPYVTQKFPTARLGIAGEGWLRHKLETLIQSHGLDRHVTLLGERRDVGTLLHLADVFVFPSLYEGAANSLLEAMAAGKPSVVSRIPSLTEISGDGEFALLANLRSPEDVAAGLLRLMEDPELATRLGRSAQSWVRRHYDIGQSVAAWEALYDRLAVKGIRGSPGDAPASSV